MKLQMIQAAQGDCFVVEGGGPNPAHILIDGGPGGTYPDHCRAVLQAISAAGGQVDLMVASHVDGDHIEGFLEMLTEIEQQRTSGNPETTAVQGLWHNTFDRTVDTDGTIVNRLDSALAVWSAPMTMSTHALLGMEEGHNVRLRAQQLGIAMNQGFDDGVVRLDTAPGTVAVGGMTLRVVGPTEANLEELRAKWDEWLSELEGAIAGAQPDVAANSDRSVPNLSSIMVLAEEGGKKLLMTGDGRSDHLRDGLREAGLLDANDAMHVDVLKLPHHGSKRNVTLGFLRKVTADCYVVSANGMYDNPDYDTLRWIVKASDEQNRHVHIVASNETDGTRKLLQERPPAQHDYELQTMPQASDSITIDI